MPRLVENPETQPEQSRTGAAHWPQCAGLEGWETSALGTAHSTFRSLINCRETDASNSAIRA